MTGIVSFGAYIPLNRFSRDKLAQIWGKRVLKGERAVTNFDEDSVTMAVAAVLDCMGGMEPKGIKGLFFATTTSPFLERQAASLIANAGGMSREVRTADFTGSLRAGTTAFASALDAVSHDSAGNVMVVASDCRLGAPGSELEQLIGDGAAALAVGNQGVLASVEASHFVAEDMLDVWRNAGDRFVRVWEPGFTGMGYTTVMKAAISELMKKYEAKPNQFSKVVFNAPNPRLHSELGASLGFDVKAQVQDPLFLTMGNTGTASALMMVVAALEQAKPGDRILLANYGHGCDAFVLRVTDEIGKIKQPLGIKGHLASKKEFTNYENLLQQREMIESEGSRREADVASAIHMWRDRSSTLELYGSKCSECGTPQFPKARVCVICGTKDRMEPYKFADKRGKIFTFTKEFISPLPVQPLVEAVVDFEGGGRMVCDLTDVDPSKVEIGMPVEMTFRHIYERHGITNYFWKARPVRG